VRKQEVLDLSGMGPTLLPGPRGFLGAAGTVRLNPSYFAIHQLRAFAREDPQGPWERIARWTPAFLRAACPKGLAPDWVIHRGAAGFHADPISADRGSYDAIRVYLWAGLLHRSDPAKPELMRVLRGMLELVAARPAELPRFVHAETGAVEEEAPAGFSAALLPYLHSAQRPDLVIAQRARFERLDSAKRPPTYYDQVLALFGLGAMDGAFRFDIEGRLIAIGAAQNENGGSGN
jgi:endoglucanase